MMAKTNKELTAEIVIAYVQSWNNSQYTKPMQPDELVDTIKTVYSTICGLSNDQA